MNKVLFVIVIASLITCQKKEDPLFSLRKNTGVDFTNTLTETKGFNVFNYRNFYNGGGVAIGDINNDGLSDIFFTGNQVSNKLYLNQGELKFKDISAEAGFRDKEEWSTGVNFVDINNDGWLDIYVCNAGHLMDSLQRKNQLFINNHDLTFTEKGAQYGLDEMGYSTQASFFDYDKDGDLDCFIVDNSPIPVNTLNFANKREIPAHQWNVAPFLRGGGDHLYRNDNDRFNEVTQQAGIHGSLISLGLGVTVGDVNKDGYPDIYVSNDFFERDYLYVNQKDGTFKDEIESWVQHTSLASMGADMQDINNDGYPDFFTTDMLPDDDYRLKTTATFDNYDTYQLKVKSGFYHQFMQNTLQLNNGNGKFTEISNYSGVPASDWSWGALMFDADNDRYNDLYICNGIRYDLTDQDFINFFSSNIVQKMATTGKREEMNTISSGMSSVPLKNKVYRNQGNLVFKEVGDEWGFGQPSFSNGASYGDLDNDGDLDLVVSNVNAEAFVYENNSNTQKGNNYLAFVLKGFDKNTFAIGSKVEVFIGSETLYKEAIPSRGFQSSIDYKLLFGLGKSPSVDSVVVTWADGNVQHVNTPVINKVYTVQYTTPHGSNSSKNNFANAMFLPHQVEFEKHREDEYVDYYSQRNIPRMLSKDGPRAAVGDVNGDGLDDIYVCGGIEQGGQLYLQNKAGEFVKSSQKAFDANHEEVVALFFDCDNDGDLDLYVGAGGNNQPPRSPKLDHRLFKNNGRGFFSLEGNAFPPNMSNVGAAVSVDFDSDGDNDLFIGGRCLSYIYGLSPDSYFFQNDGKGKFTQINLSDNKIGMITGAAVADVADGPEKEIIIVGEWMSPKIIQWNKDGLKQIPSNLDSLSGWWQTVASSDLDGDGKVDLILGNIGENFYLKPDKTHPSKLWINYFGVDGSLQQFITRTINQKNLPVFMKRNLEEQFVYLKKENLSYTTFAPKSVEELFGEEKTREADKKIFNFCPSVIAWNEGGGKFSIEKLPPEIQFSSVNTISCADMNDDGNTDLVTAGNIYDFTPQFGRLDANFGSLLINKGGRKFQLYPTKNSGIQLEGQIRDSKVIITKGVPSILFLRNNDFPVLYKKN
jgi:hypothetical protein